MGQLKDDPFDQRTLPHFKLEDFGLVVFFSGQDIVAVVGDKNLAHTPRPLVIITAFLP